MYANPVCPERKTKLQIKKSKSKWQQLYLKQGLHIKCQYSFQSIVIHNRQSSRTKAVFLHIYKIVLTNTEQLGVHKHK